MMSLQRTAALAALALATAGCTATMTEGPNGTLGPAQITLDTPGGFYPLGNPAYNTGAQGLEAPPGLFAGSTGAPPVPPAGGWENGTYDGVATLLENDFGWCAYRITMTNMHVNDGHVRFASFHGRIGPDGGVRMADGSMNWMTGHFVGGHFSGSYSNEYCAYALSLDRVGP